MGNEIKTNDNSNVLRINQINQLKGQKNTLISIDLMYIKMSYKRKIFIDISKNIIDCTCCMHGNQC